MNKGFFSAERRVLDPLERISEILFGLIMVLSFTGSVSVATAAREEVKTVLIAAIGCNLAWGLVDAVMYVLSNLTERGKQFALLQRIRGETKGSDAAKLISEILPAEISGAVTDSELVQIAERVRHLPGSGRKVRITGRDARGAAAVFLLVFLSTFPVVLPFLFSDNLFVAMRWSNAVAVAMMFLGGYSLGKYAGFSAMLVGLVMVGLGILLVALTIALGG